MNRPTLLLAMLTLLGVVAGPLRAEWRVWTTSETRHVLRDDPAEHRLAVNLAAARNEWRSFQILLRSDEPVKEVNIVPADLVGPDGAVLRAADARLFRQHQLELRVGTYRNDQFRPGWYPDALIPFRHPITGKPLGGARFTAVPFDLPVGQTHGFWVDLYVPAGAKPGPYRGSYRVTAERGKAVDVPVTLTAWDFELPPTPTMQTAFDSPARSLRGYYQKLTEKKKEKAPADWNVIDHQCNQMLSEHRINATPAETLRPVAQPDGWYRIPDNQVRALREFIDRYHVNAVEVPNPQEVITDPERQRAKLYAWLAGYGRAAKELDRPQVVFFTYLIDEPNDLKAYQFVQKWGRIVREAKSAVKVLVVEQPQPQDEKWGNLYGAVDIWCPLFSLFEAKPAAARRALGETIWTYTALCQGAKNPWWQIDYPLLNYRVPAWISWHYQIRGLLYWSMTFWDQVEDPWTDPKTLDRRNEGKDILFNGEGMLLYPGRAVGYDGVAPSIRLKALRDSIEDYEYLATAQRLGLAAEAEKIVLPLAGSWYQWNADPAAYDVARAKLAAMIVAAQGNN